MLYGSTGSVRWQDRIVLFNYNKAKKPQIKGVKTWQSVKTPQHGSRVLGRH